MIPRTLVPTDVRPVTDNGDKKPPRRLSTYMDDRTVVPSELTDGAAPLDGKTTIPSHLPLGVLVDRTLVSRSMPAKQFEKFRPYYRISFARYPRFTRGGPRLCRTTRAARDRQIQQTAADDG